MATSAFRAGTQSLRQRRIRPSRRISRPGVGWLCGCLSHSTEGRRRERVVFQRLYDIGGDSGGATFRGGEDDLGVLYREVDALDDVRVRRWLRLRLLRRAKKSAKAEKADWAASEYSMALNEVVDVVPAGDEQHGA